MLNKEWAKSHISELKNKKILVIGDCMLDEYHWCKVSRISPEAPVPVCRVDKTTLVPGGAANVAHNIQTLSGSAYLVGTIGKDSTGDKLTQLLKSHSVDTSGLFQLKSKPTILKSRIIAHQQQVVRVDREDDAEITLKDRNKLFKFIEANIQDCDAILLSDYLKGTLTERFIQRIVALALEHKKGVIVDPKGDSYKKYKGATILTPNFSEFQAIINKKVQTEADIHKEALKLIKRLNLRALLVTRSEKGMSIITREQKTDIPTQAKEVYDITGAGDTVISVLTLALAAGWTVEESCYIANFAAGIVVGKLGTATTTLDEIQSTLTKK